MIKETRCNRSKESYNQKTNIETNTYIMTFDQPKIPEKIKVGYTMERVEQFLPNPLHSYNCQKKSLLGTTSKPQSKIHLNTRLQAIAVKVTLHRTINICFIYILPHDAINESEINNISQQLPAPFILLEAQTTKAKHSKISLTIIISAYSTKNHQHTWIHHLLPTQPLI